MRSSGLRDLAVWVWLHGMNKIRESDGVLNEENGDIVANDICVSIDQQLP